jgi:hypothetical protein
MNGFPIIFKNTNLVKIESRLLSYLNHHDSDFGMHNKDEDYWKGRVLGVELINDEEIQRELTLHGLQIIEAIGKIFPKNPAFSDTLHIVKWPDGLGMPLHADGQANDGGHHDYFWRQFGSVTFLNDNFADGFLNLPNQKMRIKPETGKTVIFPGTSEYLHEVIAARGGIRYTLASFLSFDETHKADHIYELYEKFSNQT